MCDRLFYYVRNYATLYEAMSFNASWIESLIEVPIFEPHLNRKFYIHSKKFFFTITHREYKICYNNIFFC